MCTPFDDITWRLGHPGHSHPFPNPPTIAQPDAVISQAALTNLYPGHYPVANPDNFLDQTFEQVPLRSHTSFIITIAADDSAEVKFLDPTSQNSKKIWAGAQNVYYDREFYAVRGELMYNTQTGRASPYTFGHHFVISYAGRKATGGFKRQVSIELYGEDSIATPTFDLLHLQYEQRGMPAKFGSWKADD